MGFFACRCFGWFAMPIPTMMSLSQCVFVFSGVFMCELVFVLFCCCFVYCFSFTGIVTAADYLPIHFCALSLAGLCASIRFLCSRRHATDIWNDLARAKRHWKEKIAVGPGCV